MVRPGGTPGERSDVPSSLEILAVELRVAIMRTSRRLRTEASGSDLTPIQLGVLAALRESSRTNAQLAEREQVQSPWMTRTVASLEERGYVRRAPDPDDGRQSLVSITGAGRDAISRAQRLRSAWLARRLSDLGEDELAILATAARLIQHLSRD